MAGVSYQGRSPRDVPGVAGSRGVRAQTADVTWMPPGCPGRNRATAARATGSVHRTAAAWPDGGRGGTPATLSVPSGTDSSGFAAGGMVTEPRAGARGRDRNDMVRLRLTGHRRPGTAVGRARWRRARGRRRFRDSTAEGNRPPWPAGREARSRVRAGTNDTDPAAAVAARRLQSLLEVLSNGLESQARVACDHGDR